MAMLRYVTFRTKRHLSLTVQIAQTAKDDLKALWYTVVHALLGSLPWQYLAQFVELTKWAKEGWHNDFAEVKDEQCVHLVSLYNLMDVLPEPHQAWQRYLTVQ